MLEDGVLETLEVPCLGGALYIAVWPSTTALLLLDLVSWWRAVTELQLELAQLKASLLVLA